ncbi:MAG: hypothetical protein GEU80_17940 [Dehalococcoidia bacterium]|nr:hypothetical protein [Dehalococcoidia bacterium]
MKAILIIFLQDGTCARASDRKTCGEALNAQHWSRREAMCQGVVGGAESIAVRTASRSTSSLPTSTFSVLASSSNQTEHDPAHYQRLPADHEPVKSTRCPARIERGCWLDTAPC